MDELLIGVALGRHFPASFVPSNSLPATILWQLIVACHEQVSEWRNNIHSSAILDAVSRAAFLRKVDNSRPP